MMRRFLNPLLAFSLSGCEDRAAQPSIPIRVVRPTEAEQQHSRKAIPTRSTRFWP